MTDNTPMSPEEHKKTISTKEALFFGWDAFKETYRIFIPALLITIGLSFMVSFLEEEKVGDTLMIIAGVLGTIAQIIIGLGLVKVSLRTVDGERVVFDDIFSVTHLFFSYLGASLLYSLIVFGGFLLLIIPGIIWTVTYWLFQYTLVDREKGVFDALRSAKEASTGVRWELAGFMFVSGVINIAGILAFGVGLLVSLPVTMLATAYVYRSLTIRVSDAEKESVKKRILEEVPTAV
ncbi:MAG: hypothetical protein COU90_04400 [Candidatus Ryanbacteria bacterium CG10_big_fil_rev_8_21_14_0_10_43_42]|uniref:Glycerophosphoryl diester phosphodiesterase membrane domain-containing protein n=1 Tax=Candidatus Ryanbacteria bacterium CG10_big_fil_rev_8_21_14_0_10_43_42 TaxID=1974864 RepID=A0A2M8KVZ5_9BACT|nr:MAG: hypothetical protein COU90_04400 [Candidatus Ryanbacteria bacterium CG10_big_fil_rev_8_21_14_0_10_43_42]